MKPDNLHSILQQLRLLTKYGMTGMLLLMTAHCALLYYGYDSFVVHLLFVAFVMLTALSLSRIFRLCWIHKLSIIYSMSVIMCVVMRRHNMFDTLGIDLHIARGVMFHVGILIIILTIWNLLNKKNCFKS